jgi:hypothetical protein
MIIIYPLVSISSYLKIIIRFRLPVFHLVGKHVWINKFQKFGSCCARNFFAFAQLSKLLPYSASPCPN